MKKVLSLTLMALILGSGLAMAEQRIAVVDVQAVVSKSAQVQALKKEQQTKMQELEKWLTTARAFIFAFSDMKLVLFSTGINAVVFISSSSSLS